MIHVTVKCDCVDIPPEAGETELNFSLSLADGATVDDILRACVPLTSLTYEQLVCGRIFVRDNRIVDLDQPLQDGDRVLMLRAMAGG